MNERDRAAVVEQAWRTSLVILVSLPIGVTLLAAVGLWLNARNPGEGTEAAPLVWIWLFLTVATSGAALVMWRRLVQPHLPVSGVRGEPASAEEVGRMQTGLVVCMALVEGAALFGGVLLIIGAGPLPALVGVIVTWTAFFLLRPRRAWYGLR